MFSIIFQLLAGGAVPFLESASESDRGWRYGRVLAVASGQLWAPWHSSAHLPQIVAVSIGRNESASAT